MDRLEGESLPASLPRCSHALQLARGSCSGPSRYLLRCVFGSG